MTPARARPWLIAIWLCFVARGAFYAAAMPLWEGFDEWAHFAVIERIAVRGEMLPSRYSPVSRTIETSLNLAPVPWELRYRESPSLTEDVYWRLPLQERARREEEFQLLSSNWSHQDSTSGLQAYEALQAPLYYWIAAPIFLLGTKLTLAGQVLLLRLLDVAIASATIPLGFAVARAALGNDTLGLGCAAVIATMPELAIDAARIANDCLAIAIFTWLTLLLARYAGSESSRRQTVWIGIALGAGLLAKAYFLAAIPAVLFVLVYAFWAKGWRRMLESIASVFLITLAIAGWWYVRNFVETGTLSGLNEAVMLRGSTGAARGITAHHWISSTDAILFSHLWFGGWSSLTVRSWMYHVFYLAIIAAGAGLLKMRWRPEVLALAAIYGAFWAGQFYNVWLLFAAKGTATSMGWYMYAVVAAEVVLSVAGLRAMVPPPARRYVAAWAVCAFALLDLYSLHAVALPYYSGLIAHRNNGLLTALHVADFRRLGLHEVTARLTAYHAVSVFALEMMWAAYMMATAALIGIALAWSKTDADPSL